MSTITVGIPRRDQLKIEVDGFLLKAVSGKGCYSFLEKLSELRSHIGQDLKTLALPNGSDHISLIIKEALLKARQEWAPPYQEEELCHCRKVNTEAVMAAIKAGYHHVEEIADQTQAGTSCGNCRVDSEALIHYFCSGN